MSAGELHTSTKLDGYVWVANTEKVIHVPRDRADDVEMEDDDVQEETQFLPSLQVIVRPQVKTSKEEDVSSLQREETSQQAGPSEDEEPLELDIARIRRPEDRYGHFIVRQLKPEHQLLLKDMAFNSQNVLTDDDREGRSPLCRDEIGYFSLVFMLEYLASESLTTFMEAFGPSTRTDISYDEHHDFHLELKRVAEANKNVTQDNFEDTEEPDLMDDDPNIPLQRREDQGRADPEFKGTVESLSRENKQIILETEDDDLVDCTTMWLSMYNKTVQKKIMERVVKSETKEEEVEVEEEQEESQEPTVPPPAQASMECQTDESFLSGSKARSSFQKEEPVPPEGSLQKEVSGEPQADLQQDDTPKSEPAKRLYFGADITGNEGDSFFRKLAECFTDGYHGEWAGFCNQGYPASSQHRHMFWHVKYRTTMAPHQDHWYSNTDDQLIAEYIARHKDQLPLQELEISRIHVNMAAVILDYIYNTKNMQRKQLGKQKEELMTISKV